MFGDDQTRAVLGQLDDSAFVEEYPESKQRLHIDASELNHVAFDKHWSDLQEEAVSLAVVVDELNCFSLLQQFFCLEDHR